MATSLPTSQATLEHFLRSLVYRFNHVTSETPEGFGDFEAAEGVRSPSAIVRHMSGLLGFTQSQLEGTPRVNLEPLPWEEELSRFVAVAQGLERSLQSSLEAKGDIELDRLWRGPLTDAMTHVGQLATLRRLAGSPVEGVRYWQVDMPPLNKPS